MLSSIAFERAKKVIPGGVNSPVRAFSGVGGSPLFINRGQGAYVEDLQGKRYIDYVGSYGPMIHGHAHPYVVDAVAQAAGKGMSFGAPTETETRLAEKITARVRGVDMVRMCNSGTEATMSAIRLARSVNGKDQILKFSGCYHGHSDGLLVSAGSGALTLGVPDSLGIPESFAQHTLTAPYNDIQALENVFAHYGVTLAAVIVEPIAGNMSCVPASLPFHRRLRELCDEYGCVLIWDEVMSGFRVASGGAQEIYGIDADIFTFGKVIGGGMPVGAFAAKKEIMQLLAPLGGVYQAGTLSGNPVSMAAGIANLELTETADFYPRLDALTERLANGLRDVATKNHVDLVVNACCGMLGLFFTELKKVDNFTDVQTVDKQRFSQFFHASLNTGVYLAPSVYETIFVSAAHTEAIIDETIDIVDTVFAKLEK